MSYTIETTPELFLITESFGINDDLHIVMSKREVQEFLKSPFAHLITDIQRLQLTRIETMSKKRFLT